MYINCWKEIQANGTEETCPKLLIPIILFIDGTQIDLLGRHNMEPILFTLGIFNCGTRRRHDAWRCLGFIRDSDPNETSIGDHLSDTVHDPAERDLPTFGIEDEIQNSFPKKDELGHVPNKVRDYHAKVQTIMKDLIIATNNDEGYMCQLKLNGTDLPTKHKLVFRIGFIIGDTVAHDKMVCLEKGGNTGNNICRNCD